MKRTVHAFDASSPQTVAERIQDVLDAHPEARIDRLHYAAYGDPVNYCSYSALLVLFHDIPTADPAGTADADAQAGGRER